MNVSFTPAPWFVADGCIFAGGSEAYYKVNGSDLEAACQILELHDDDGVLPSESATIIDSIVDKGREEADEHIAFSEFHGKRHAANLQLLAAAPDLHTALLPVKARIDAQLSYLENKEQIAYWFRDPNATTQITLTVAEISAILNALAKTEVHQDISSPAGSSNPEPTHQSVVS